MVLKNKKQNKSRGGDAGEIFIAARKIVGNGSIEAIGGDGSVGGKGGKITIISDDNQFMGNILADGGKSSLPLKWWENTLVQIIMLVGSVVGIISILYEYGKK